MANLDHLNLLLTSLPVSNLPPAAIGSSQGIWDVFQGSLKEEAKEKICLTNFLDVRIQDIANEKLKTFKVDFKNYFFEVTKNKTYNRFLEDLKRNHPNCTIDDLKEKKRNAVKLAIEEFADNSARTKLKALLSGKSLREALETRINSNLNFSISPRDFSNSKTKGKEEDFPLTLEEQQSLNKDLMRSTLKSHLIKKENIKKIDLFFSKVRSLETVYCHVLQLKFFKKIAENSVKSLHEILPEDYGNYEDVASKLLDAEKNRQEKKASRIAEELIQAEAKTKASTTRPSGSSKKKKTKKKAAEKNDLNSDSQKTPGNSNANDNAGDSKDSSSKNGKSEEVVHPNYELLARLNSSTTRPELIPLGRITRWTTTDKKVVREFLDFDPITGTPVQNYKSYDDATLINLMNNHNLAGIERLCSNQTILENYTFSYSFWDAKGVEKKCRGFYAIKVFEKRKEHGIVYVGIGRDGFIYHAMFEPLTDRDLCPQNLVKALDSSDSQENLETEEKWQQIGRTSFTMDEDDVIQMDICRDRFPTLTYKFYPLT